jgi:hypothetical protein
MEQYDKDILEYIKKFDEKYKMKNYTVIHYIQNQLKGFNRKFIDCVIRCFNLIEKYQEPNGCLSDSVALFICAKEYGYMPKLCYGLCSVDGIEFYHAWLEIDTTIIDLAIYGNINYRVSPLIQKQKLDTPYIGTYENSNERNIHYGRFQFDEDWSLALIAQKEGLSFIDYMNGLPNNAMWKLVCILLDKTPTYDFVNHLKTLVTNDKIERKLIV